MTPPDPPVWLVLTGSTPSGPYPPADVRTKLAAGEATTVTPACPVGGDKWVPLGRLPGYAPAADAAPPPPPYRPAARPWNPAAIGWLSILFTPVWGGILAAVNARRLGRRGAVWAVLAGIGFLVLQIPLVLIPFGLYPPYWADLGAYLLTVLGFWAVALRPQAAAFREWAAAHPGTPAGGWAVPAALGSPLALLVAFSYGIDPLLPIGPAEVCDRFVCAATAAEAKRYATPALAPAVDAMYQTGPDGDGGGDARFEFYGEQAAPPEMGGRVVWFFGVAVEEAGRTQVVEGYFHVVDGGSEWRVADMALTAAGGIPIDPPTVLSRDYGRMFPPPAARAGPRAAGRDLHPAVGGGGENVDGTEPGVGPGRRAGCGQRPDPREVQAAAVAPLHGGRRGRTGSTHTTGEG